MERIQKMLQQRGAGQSTSNDRGATAESSASAEAGASDGASARSGNQPPGESGSAAGQSDGKEQSRSAQAAEGAPENGGTSRSDERGAGDRSSAGSTDADRSLGEGVNADPRAGPSNQSTPRAANGTAASEGGSAVSGSDSSATSELPAGRENDTADPANADQGASPATNRPAGQGTGGDEGRSSNERTDIPKTTGDFNAIRNGGSGVPGGSTGPSEGSGDGSNSAPPVDAGAPGADAANLEYARRSADLVLEYLERQREQPDSELLRDLRWAPDDLKRFVDRWKAAKELGSSVDPNLRRQYDDQLRSLGLRAPTAARGGSTATARGPQGGMLDAGQRSRPPAAVQDAFDAYRRSVGRPRPPQ
jgi:hypothetical protein